MTFGEIAQRLVKYALDHPEQRNGQAMFNALHEFDPELADTIRGTDADPFYDNLKVEAFVGKICEKYGLDKP